MRTQEEINQEYTQHAAYNGDKAHAIAILKEQIVKIEADMQALHIKMATLQAEKAAAPKAIEPEVLPAELFSTPPVSSEESQ